MNIRTIEIGAIVAVGGYLLLEMYCVAGAVNVIGVLFVVATVVYGICMLDSQKKSAAKVCQYIDRRKYPRLPITNG